MSHSVASNYAYVQGSLSPDDTMPVAPKRAPRLYPYVILPGIAEQDTALDIKTRLLAALQQQYGASFTEWTPPLIPRTLGEHFQRSALTMSRALTYLYEHGYIERQYVSRPKGGRCYQYRLAMPHGANGAGWKGVA